MYFTKLIIVMHIYTLFNKILGYLRDPALLTRPASLKAARLVSVVLFEISLTAQQKIELAKRLHFDYNASEKQLKRYKKIRKEKYL